MSWDEEVHFAQAFWMANYRTPVQADPALLQEFTAGVDTWPYNQPENQDEQAALTSYLNRMRVTGTVNISGVRISTKRR